MKDKMRMSANISAVFSGIVAKQDLRRSGHDDIDTQAGYDTQQQAGHETIQTGHDVTQARHDTQPAISDNVPAGRDDAANFWGGYVSSYPGGTNAGLQSRYELYIGFLHETRGWDVQYNSLIPGSNGLRRGLICRKGDKARIVHCLFRPENNIIHENFIYILFGMASQYKHDRPNLRVYARFSTSAGFDDRAKKVAKRFNVGVSEHLLIQNFPYVKCIANANGQRIYYTPYDNEYFTANTTTRLWTIQQAQAQGFIHGV